ncbi:hypothetical protein D3C81_2089180 [compost metagenome]
MRVFGEEAVENFPVGQRLPIFTIDFDADQAGAFTVGNPGAVANPLFRHTIHGLFIAVAQLYPAQLTLILHVIQETIVRG